MQEIGNLEWLKRVRSIIEVGRKPGQKFVPIFQSFAEVESQQIGQETCGHRLVIIFRAEILTSTCAKYLLFSWNSEAAKKCNFQAVKEEVDEDCHKVHQRQHGAVLQKIPSWGIIYTGPDNTYTMHVHIIIYTAWLVGWLPLWPPSTFSGEVEDKIVFG